MQLHNMLKLKAGWISGPGPEQAGVLSSRVRLARNLADSRFPGKASPKDLKAVLEKCWEAARKTKSLSKAAYLGLKELEPLDRRFLMERHLISHELADQNESRGVVIGDKEMLSLMVNEEDHLRLQSIEAGFSLKEAYKKAAELDADLSNKISFAFDGQWGHLTACPTNVGTGMRASCLVHLPALGLQGKINPILEGLSRLGMAIRGLYGEGTRVLGDFFQISNATALGRSEEEMIGNLESALKALVQKEKQAQKEIAEGSDRLRLEDRIYRSLGILQQARSISFEESMQHLSSLRLGLSLKLELTCDLTSLNELLLILQPAHVQMAAHKELSPAERDFLRAQILRKRLAP